MRRRIAGKKTAIPSKLGGKIAIPDDTLITTSKGCLLSTSVHEIHQDQPCDGRKYTPTRMEATKETFTCTFKVATPQGG